MMKYLSFSIQLLYYILIFCIGLFQIHPDHYWPLLEEWCCTKVEEMASNPIHITCAFYYSYPLQWCSMHKFMQCIQLCILSCWENSIVHRQSRDCESIRECHCGGLTFRKDKLDLQLGTRDTGQFVRVKCWIHAMTRRPKKMKVNYRNRKNNIFYLHVPLPYFGVCMVWTNQSILEMTVCNDKITM